MEDGSCLRCPVCGSYDIDQRVISRLEYTPTEIAEYCGDCKTCVSYWAYGSWDPAFYVNDKSIEMMIRRFIWKLKRLF